MPREILLPGSVWAVSDQRLFFGMQEIRKADLSSFHVLGEWWARDATKAYCAGSEIRDANVNTFQVLNTLYAKDARRAYTMKGPILEVDDVACFEVIGGTDHPFNTSNGYAKDSRRVYHTILGAKACEIKGADAASFIARGHGYGSDKANVYYERKKVVGADPTKWQHIRGPHSRSGKNAYFLGKRIRGADGESLESLPQLLAGHCWSRDSNNYYRDDQPADPKE